MGLLSEMKMKDKVIKTHYTMQILQFILVCIATFFVVSPIKPFLPDLSILKLLEVYAVPSVESEMERSAFIYST